MRRREVEALIDQKILAREKALAAETHRRSLVDGLASAEANLTVMETMYAADAAEVETARAFLQNVQVAVHNAR